MLEYIKRNRKEFVSGVYSTVFMSSIRRLMSQATGGGSTDGAKKDEDSTKKRRDTEGKSAAGPSKKARTSDKASKTSP